MWMVAHFFLMCGKKYTKTHKCGNHAGTINLIEETTMDGGTFLSDEILEALETPKIFLMEDDCYLSLHALSVNQSRNQFSLELW
jgi:hypothetical protein